VPIVVVAGCARATATPGVWSLTAAGRPRESASAGITREERDLVAAEAPGDQQYVLVGVAEFVDAETSRRIGVRGQLLPASRVNATGMLVDRHDVAAKGLYLPGSPARINLTSVVDLGRTCGG